MNIRNAVQAHRSRKPQLLAAGIVALLGVSAVAGTLVQPGLAGASSSPTTIMTAHNKTWGTILVLGNGTTVYRLAADPKNKSVCSGTCATIWPPVLLASGPEEPGGPRRARPRHHHPGQRQAPGDLPRRAPLPLHRRPQGRAGDREHQGHLGPLVGRQSGQPAHGAHGVASGERRLGTDHGGRFGRSVLIP